MSNYVCKYGLYHHKSCNGTKPEYSSSEVIWNPRSNNGWIYTAYANELLLDVDIQKINETYSWCEFFADKPFYITRLPDKQEPPISRDEIIGMYSLGFDPLKRESWVIDKKWFMFSAPMDDNFDVVEPSVKEYFKAIKILWSIRKEHRNYVWENKLIEAYILAFKIMWHDRYYINKKMRLKPTRFQWLMFQIYALSTILQDNTSAKNILWLQLKDLDSRFWIKFIDQKKNFLEYFGESHIFNKNIGEECV